MIRMLQSFPNLVWPKRRTHSPSQQEDLASSWHMRPENRQLLLQCCVLLSLHGYCQDKSSKQAATTPQGRFERWMESWLSTKVGLTGCCIPHSLVVALSLYSWYIVQEKNIPLLVSICNVLYRSNIR